MIREIEATGKTVELAYAAGCEQLGVSPDDLNVSYEIIDMPVNRLFRKLPAKVKITVTLPDPAPKTAAAPAPAKAEPAETPAPAAAPAPEQPAPAAQEPAAEAPAEAPAAPAEDAEPEEVALVIDDEPKVKAAVDYLRSVVVHMGVTDAEFTAVRKGEATIIKVTGSNMGALIGRRGETMESLSYLASLVANRLEGDYIKLGLDVGGYRGKREQDLTALAQRIGAKVKKTGRSFAMEPMNPYERRIIHSAISAMDGVRSESKGEGKDRRVVIYSTAPNAQNDNPDHERRGSRGGNGRSRSNGPRSGRGGDRREGGPRKGRDGSRGPRREGGRGPRPSSVPERSYVARDAQDAAPVAPKRTERVDDFADLGFGKIEL